MTGPAVLVTGAAGYLGRAIAASLHRSGIRPSKCDVAPGDGIIQCDLTIRADVARLFDLVSPQIIIHTAALVPRNAQEYASAQQADKNLEMVHALVESGRARLVFISSMTVYGEPRGSIVLESDAAPLSSYARGKFAAEQMLSASLSDYVIPRLPGLFGLPRRDGLIGNLLRAAFANETPTLPLQPLVWSALLIEDAAEAIVRLALNTSAHGPVNIGYPGPISVNRLVQVVERITDRRFDYRVEHPDFAMDLRLANTFNAQQGATFAQRVEDFARDLTGREPKGLHDGN